MLHQINDTTYSVDGLGDVKPSVLIGGKTADKFIPNVNASFYDDEFFINLNRKGKPAVTGKSSLAEIGGDDKDIFHIDDRGRLKWDIEFGECPKFLTLSWEIKCSEGIEFLYQGPLTEDEVADGCIRADDIVGSYAVYCNKTDNKYKTGKLCHIPRPFVVDNDGNREWCTLLIDNDVLTITLPESFMQSATYPARLDPTFGYTTAGASDIYNYNSDKPLGMLYGAHTAESGDIITQFSFYGTRSGSTNSELNVAAYSIVSSDLSARLGSETSIPATSATDQWWSSSTVSIAMTAGTIYGLACGAYGEAYGEASGIKIKYDSGDGNYCRHNTAEALPSDWTSDVSGQYRIMSLYATYEEGGGTTGNNYYYQQNQ